MGKPSATNWRNPPKFLEFLKLVTKIKKEGGKFFLPPKIRESARPDLNRQPNVINPLVGGTEQATTSALLVELRALNKTGGGAQKLHLRRLVVLCFHDGMVNQLPQKNRG